VTLPGVADEREQEPARSGQRVSIGAAEEQDAALPLDYRIERVLDEFRLAVLGVVLGLGLTILFGVQQEAGWLWGAVAGVASVAGLVILFRWRRSRDAVARLLD
jgi:hypothetical protein